MKDEIGETVQLVGWNVDDW